MLRRCHQKFQAGGLGEGNIAGPAVTANYDQGKDRADKPAGHSEEQQRVTYLVSTTNVKAEGMRISRTGDDPENADVEGDDASKVLPCPAGKFCRFVIGCCNEKRESNETTKTTNSF